jgi:negative regulator of flagellin synthesis FlgM
MTMKIGSSTTTVTPASIKDSRTISSGKAKGASTDDVKLSSLATQLSSTAESEAPFDTARVAEIKQAIASGQFTIDASAISERLIASAKEMINFSR